MFFRALQQSIVLYGNTIFLWKSSIRETWITFHWYMYLIYSNLIQFKSNPIQIYLIYIIQSNPIKPKQIQSNPVQSNPFTSNPIQSNPIQSNPIQSI